MNPNVNKFPVEGEAKVFFWSKEKKKKNDNSCSSFALNERMKR